MHKFLVGDIVQCLKYPSNLSYILSHDSGSKHSRLIGLDPEIYMYPGTHVRCLGPLGLQLACFDRRFKMPDTCMVA